TTCNGDGHFPFDSPCPDCSAQPAPVVPDAISTLIRHASGEIQHANLGLCPDEIEGHDSRDPECQVCQAMVALLAAAPAQGKQVGLPDLNDPETVLVNMLRGTIAIPPARSWSKLFGDVLNDEDARLLEIARLRA